MITRRDAHRLQDLLRRRLAQLEARLRNADAERPPAPVELEREAKAITALMKALQSAAEMERAHAQAEDAAQPDDENADATLRCRLAQQLEALCAQTRPPRRGGSAGT